MGRVANVLMKVKIAGLDMILVKGPLKVIKQQMNRMKSLKKFRNARKMTERILQIENYNLTK